jgi:hypothetical protein
MFSTRVISANGAEESAATPTAAPTARTALAADPPQQ